MVGFDLIPVDLGQYPGVESQRWADADVGQAADYMRWTHENPDAARQLGERGRARIASQLAPATVGSAMVRLFAEPEAIGDTHEVAYR